MRWPIAMFLAVAGCSGSRNESAPASDKLPRLLETPADDLGTAPRGRGLHIGDRAPEATLDDVTGTKRRLSEFHVAGPMFVVFYRGGWCPFCNVQLHELAQARPEFDRLGVKLVAISVDRANEAARLQAREGVPFAMLSDPDLVAHRAFDVVHVADEAQRQRLASLGIDLAAYSGATHHSFAIPSVFLVDQSGTIRFAHLDEDYETRPSPRQLLEIAARALTR